MDQNPQDSKPIHQLAKALPDTPGLWFYQATRLPVTVIDKEGVLYFQGGQNGEEEMALTEFAKLLEGNESLASFGFIRLEQFLNGPIASLN